MHRLTIVDAFCPRPYDERSLHTAPMGGTESSTVLLAEALGQFADLQISVLQHCRADRHVSPAGVCYDGIHTWRLAAASCQADTVIIINSPKLLGLWHRRMPHPARLLLWRHNYLGHHYKRLAETLRTCRASMVCVSQVHQQASLERMVHWQRSKAPLPISWIANPVSVHYPREYSVDPDKLLFCSSPHKGLTDTLARFAEVRESLPSLTLQICNPGYLADEIVRQPGVTSLGALTRPMLHQHIAESLCVFYPQDRFAETFGLIAAEANALGTPILAPDNLGALPEVVNDARQLVSELSADTLCHRLRKWRMGSRPVVTGNPGLHPNAIAVEWRRHIGLSNKQFPVNDTMSRWRRGTNLENERPEKSHAIRSTLTASKGSNTNQ